MSPAGHSKSDRALASSPRGRVNASESESTTTMSLDKRRFWTRWKKPVRASSAPLRIKPSLLAGASNVRFRSSAIEEFQTSEPVSQLKFSSDGRYLITNCGLFKIAAIAADRATSPLDSPRILHVFDGWILYDGKPILRLPAGFDATRFDVQGDQLAIGLTNGRVLPFTIDRRRLNAST